MKSKKIELDVDFVGGQGPLTKDEEKQISEFIKSQKIVWDKKPVRKSGMATKSKANA
jgi:hypothetical protein